MEKNIIKIKKSIIIIICICLAASAGICAAIKLTAHTSTGAIGMVNGEPFFQSDLDVYALENRAAVAAHYGRKYNLNAVGAGFWETEYDGQTPRAFLEKISRDELVRNIVIIQEARKRGISTPANYHGLEAERETWNAPTDEIVYGPKTLAPAEYNSYRISGIEDELKTALLQKELAPSAAQIRAAFDSIPDEYKIAPTLVNASRISWNENHAADAEIRSSLRRAFAQGLSPEDVVSNLSASIPGLASEDLSFDSRYLSKEDPYEQSLAAILNEAGKGTVADGPENRPELLYVTQKEGGDVFTFEEAPVLGRNKWINEQYALFIDKKVKAAKVRVFKQER